MKERFAVHSFGDISFDGFMRIVVLENDVTPHVVFKVLTVTRELNSREFTRFSGQLQLDLFYVVEVNMDVS
jgi:hypothetical protein